MINYEELGLLILKELNKGDEKYTRIKFEYYRENGDNVERASTEWIVDYSPFANEKYMSKGLLNALQNGKTLTNNQLEELDEYKIDILVNL